MRPARSGSPPRRGRGACWSRRFPARNAPGGHYDRRQQSQDMRECRCNVQIGGPVMRSDQKSLRGEGRLYREPGSRFWWMAYYDHCRDIRQSTRETKKSKAETMLRRRAAAVLCGDHIPHEHKVTLGDLVAMVRADYDVHQRRSRTTVIYPLKHLRAQLGAETPALARTSDRLARDIVDRRAEGASNASIRIELAMLSKGFTLAVRARKLRIKPYIPKPEGDPSRIREGFFTRDEVDRLCTHLPDVLADVVGFLFCSPWRVGEVRTLEWRDYDRTEGAIRLRPERSKTKHGRVLPLVGELAAIIARRVDAQRLDCPYIFHNQGRPIGDFRKSWRAAGAAGGVSGRVVPRLPRGGGRPLIHARGGPPTAVAVRGDPPARRA